MNKILSIISFFIFSCEVFQPYKDFSGTWEIKWRGLKGVLIVYQRGKIVTGEYIYITLLGLPALGRIEGTVKSDTLFFTEYRDVGDVFRGFAVMEGKDTFKGYQYLFMGQYMDWWEGKRISKKIEKKFLK